jgi:hypothetical protein
VHVTRNPPAKSDSNRNLICHVARLRSDEVTLVDSFAVTNPTRTVLDLGRLIGFVPAVIAADDALHSVLTTRELLVAALVGIHGTRGSRAAARVVHFADGRSESVGESRSRVLLAEARLPSPDLQTAVYAHGGYFLGRGDFGYPEKKVLGEFWPGRRPYEARSGQKPTELTRARPRHCWSASLLVPRHCT